MQIALCDDETAYYETIQNLIREYTWAAARLYTSSPRDGVPMSSARGHGIGTRSIIAFCEKHDALYSFKAEDGWFQVTVAL